VSLVVLAMIDPFPMVARRGIALLRDAGVEVTVGVCERDAQRLNAPYLKLIRTGRPWVHAKWAMTLDGKLAARTGDSRWVSGEESRKRVHELRGRVDAVIIGRGTVVVDDPLLTARPQGPRVATRVVMSLSGELPEQCRLLTTARDWPVIIYTTSGNEAKLANWRAAGAEVIPLSDLAAALDDLGNRRFTNVLVEGGSGLQGSFLDVGAVDEFHVYVAPKIAGGGGPSPVEGVGIERMANALRVVEFTSESSGEDVYLHGYSTGVFERITG
jgi:diaminohydroxyphosphoribosylaminopyrimidine deaminase/5-amino-6-(5-phosphoribosylamino)uracil reductase